jgi:hypothetical protein
VFGPGFDKQGAIMRRAAILGLLAIAFPASALANAGTNNTTKDAIGWCVSAGNYNAFLAGETTGDNRSSYAGQPGAVAELISGARAWCSENQSNYPPPGQAH